MIRHQGRKLGDRCLASVTRPCVIPSMVGIVNRGAVVIHGKYRSSEVNKSIVISIIDRNVHRWVTTKRWFSQHDQERRPIPSVANDCLTKIYDTVALNVIQKQRKLVRKIAFTIKIEIEAGGLSHPKSIGILTVLRCISCPDLVILA